MNKHQLTISKMINGGYGLGQLPDGRLAMVRQVLPAEEVVMAVEEEKKSHLFGRPLTITRPSPARITPPCPWYASCGGCDLQHASYEEQLRIKHEILLDLLHRQDSPPLPAGLPEIPHPLPSPETLGYRQRIRLQVKDGRSLGYRRLRSHDIVIVGHCLIARPQINTVLIALQNQPLAGHLLTNSTELELLHNPATDLVTAIFHLRRKPRPADTGEARKLLTEVAMLERVYFVGEQFPLTGAAPENCSPQLALTYDRSPFGPGSWTTTWEVGGFCQVNLAQNLQMVRLVLEFAGISHDDSVLDLFCGAGNFSIPLAAGARSLLGIEGQGSAIRSACHNAALAGLANCDFRKQPTHTACQELAAAGRQFDCVVIDPPRQGVPGLASLLASLCRHRLVYISCDPATLCRDLAELARQGFHLARMQPLDMFPQTHHIETVALLEKR